MCKNWSKFICWSVIEFWLRDQKWREVFALGKNSKTFVQIFLYAFFYVSRVTNLATPRSAPDYSTNKYWQNESMQKFVNHSFMLRILSVMVLNTIYPSLYSNFSTENDSWFNNSTNKYVQNESMQNVCVHPFILRIVHVMILNITYISLQQHWKRQVL
jgi:hypothetical protein